MSTGLALVLASGCTSVPRAEVGPRQTPRADVTAEDFERAPLLSIEEVIESRVPGVWVSRGSDGTPNGKVRVRIRGAISTYTEPLYVVDGHAIHPGPDGIIFAVQRQDIQSIQVLKDPAQTAFYGHRGTNGVIVITTKQGQPKEKSAAESDEGKEKEGT